MLSMFVLRGRAACKKNKYKKIKLTKNKMHTMGERQRLVKIKTCSITHNYVKHNTDCKWWHHILKHNPTVFKVKLSQKSQF